MSHEFRNFGKAILNLSLNVIPKFIHENIELVFEKSAVGESHLIHGAINMKKFH
jgi:hypothetical protein